MEIITGKLAKPFNVLLIGVHGIGKSTWAANSPNPLFIGAEENDELHAARLPQVKSWTDFEAQLKWIITTKPKYETLVVDTIDSVEKLLHKKILEDDDKSKGNMAKAMGGYGAAYDYAMNEMTRIRDTYFKAIRDDLKMNIIILSHSKKTTATDTILGFQYDSYEMALHQKTQNVFADWVSAVFFANYLTYRADDKDTTKGFAVGAGERVLLTEKRPGHLGKNRFNLPYQLPLEFSEFYSRFKEFYKGDVKVDPLQLLEQIKGACQNIGDETLKKKIMVSVDEAGSDATKLGRILKRVQDLTGS
jgi:hypothetical protein